MRKRNKKKYLFSLYSANLAETNSGMGGEFLCPLCHCKFSYEQSDSLTIEHIVPEALGGSIETLTCKKCNNQFGANLISKLTTNFETRSKIQNSTPFDARLAIDGKSIAVDFIARETRFIMRPTRSDPKNISYIENLIKYGKTKEVELSVKLGFGPEVEEMALLLMSYLILFRTYGYRYILSRWGLRTRNVIIKNEYDSPLVKFSVESKEAIVRGDSLVFICKSPKEFENYAGIQIRLKTNNLEEIRTKILPIFPESQFNVEGLPKNQGFQIIGEPITGG